MMINRYKKWLSRGLSAWAKILSLISLLAICVPLEASDYARLFRWLNAGQYIQAKKELSEVKKMKENDAAYWYAWARFYFSPDNPEYQLDSANHFILLAKRCTPLPANEKYTQKMAQWGVRDFTINTLHEEITEQGFRRAKKISTPESMQFFIDAFQSDSLKTIAIEIRNALAFIKARESGKSVDMEYFLRQYPNARQQYQAEEIRDTLHYTEKVDEKKEGSLRDFIHQYPNHRLKEKARSALEELRFRHCTENRNIERWEIFIKEFPNGKMFLKAQDSLYVLATENKTEQAFESFVFSYPGHPRIVEAWNELYSIKTAGGSLESITIFEMYYPNNPIQERIKMDKYFLNLEVKPEFFTNRWGYASIQENEKKWIIAPRFTEAHPFSEGLAWVSEDTAEEKKQYFCIQKNGKVAFPGKYLNPSEYHSGNCIVYIVGKDKKEKSGVLRKNGSWLIHPEYDWIDEAVEGYYSVSMNDSMGFISTDGKRVIYPQYTDALFFSNAVASVETTDGWGVIDTTGNWLIKPQFASLSMFKDSLMAATLDGTTWGYISLGSEWIIPAVYSFAEDFQNGKAIVSKQETDIKNKKLKITQRYEIDRKGKVLRKISLPDTGKSTQAKKSKPKR